MYKDISYSVKITTDGSTMTTKPISSNRGLKQGCPLSPTLANVFLHDIHDSLLRHDIELNDTYLNSIAWADDLVFFFTSPRNNSKYDKFIIKFLQKNEPNY